MVLKKGPSSADISCASRRQHVSTSTVDMSARKTLVAALEAVLQVVWEAKCERITVIRID